MAVTPTREIPFDEDDLTPIVVVLADLARTGRGWVNFLPEVEEGHDPPTRNPVVAIFSARGDPVPLATWSAPAKPGGRATLGITHGTGPKALARLDEYGVGLPDGWLKVADHPRRGLVITTPRTADMATEDVDQALWWLLAASHVMSVVPLTGAWLARVFEP